MILLHQYNYDTLKNFLSLKKYLKGPKDLLRASMAVSLAVIYAEYNLRQLQTPMQLNSKDLSKERSIFRRSCRMCVFVPV